MRKGKIIALLYSLFFIFTFGSQSFSLPLPPSNLEAYIISPTHIRLTWWDNSTDEDGFILERKEVGGSWVQIARLPRDLNVYNDEELTLGGSYLYRVRAYQGEYYTPYCELSYPVTTIGYPSPPANLRGRALSSSEIELEWDDVSDNEDGFIIERKSGKNWVEVDVLPPDTESYVDKGLSENTKYTYRVLAFNGAGRTSSLEVEVKTDSSQGELYLSAGCSLGRGGIDVFLIMPVILGGLLMLLRKGRV